MEREFFPYHAVSFPIFQTSSFEFEKIEDVTEAMGKRYEGYVYTRGGNPTVDHLEKEMALLENGAAAVAFSSGMGAISNVLVSLLEAGDTIIAHQTLYSSSENFIKKILKKFGVASIFMDVNDLELLEKQIDESVKVIYFETPTNPNLELIDIEPIVQIARKHNIKVVVDNTFASPILQNPLDLGVDVVVHSATKNLNGHGDSVGGLAVSNDPDYMDELCFSYMCGFGTAMSPFNAWLILRGLETLKVRVEKMQANAQALNEYLLKHPKIKHVYYPGNTERSREVMNKQMSGPGGVLAFELVDNTLENAMTFVNALNCFKIAVSLGDTKSHVEIPSLMTHKGMTEEELKVRHVTAGMVRFAFGIEETDLLIADIEQALEQL